MRMFRSILSACCYALAMCVGMVGMASASEKLMSYQFRALALDSGCYGAESAKLKVELAHMQAIGEDRTSGLPGLVAMSNHFVQAFLTKSGVAGGKTGSNALANTLV